MPNWTQPSPAPTVIQKLMKLFRGSPVAVRPDRTAPKRPKPSFSKTGKKKRFADFENLDSTAVPRPSPLRFSGAREEISHRCALRVAAQ